MRNKQARASKENGLLEVFVDLVFSDNLNWYLFHHQWQQQ